MVGPEGGLREARRRERRPWGCMYLLEEAAEFWGAFQEGIL